MSFKHDAADVVDVAATSIANDQDGRSRGPNLTWIGLGLVTLGAVVLAYPTGPKGIVVVSGDRRSRP